MSKSSDSARSKIELMDTPDLVLRKIKKAVTDFTSQVTYEPETRPGVANLITLHSLTTGKSPEEICKEAQALDTAKWVQIVKDLGERIIQLQTGKIWEQMPLFRKPFGETFNFARIFQAQ